MRIAANSVQSNWTAAVREVWRSVQNVIYNILFRVYLTMLPLAPDYTVSNRGIVKIRTWAFPYRDWGKPLETSVKIADL
jgi:hypothetical protein